MKLRPSEFYCSVLSINLEKRLLPLLSNEITLHKIIVGKGETPTAEELTAEPKLPVLCI